MKGEATVEKFDEMSIVKEYVKAVRGLAEEYGVCFLPLQEKLDKKSAEYAPECWLWDDVRPTRVGAKLIADAWLKFYKKNGGITIWKRR